MRTSPNSTFWTILKNWNPSLDSSWGLLVMVPLSSLPQPLTMSLCYILRLLNKQWNLKASRLTDTGQLYYHRT